jgi:hypothetical protein
MPYGKAVEPSYSYLNSSYIYGVNRTSSLCNDALSIRCP